MTGYQEHTNYLWIKEYIRMAETTRFTEDRREQYKEHLDFIRSFFPSFMNISPEITDTEFRYTANCLEIYMHELHTEFNLQLYVSFLKGFQLLADRIMQEEELAVLLEAISI